VRTISEYNLCFCLPFQARSEVSCYSNTQSSSSSKEAQVGAVHEYKYQQQQQNKQQQQQLAVIPSRIPLLPPLPGATAPGGVAQGGSGSISKRQSSAGTERPTSTGNGGAAAEVVTAAPLRRHSGGKEKQLTAESPAAAGGGGDGSYGDRGGEIRASWGPFNDRRAVNGDVTDGLSASGKGEVQLGGVASSRSSDMGGSTGAIVRAVSFGGNRQPAVKGGVVAGSGADAGALEAGGVQDAAGEQGSGRLDIQHLTWEDRERVLRLLFAKINNHARQVHFNSLPSHPFPVQGQQQEQLVD
jgi:hypothetical protein